ncbi:TPA: 1-deoxy-D-xylulose-5-phosphate reductoisomerase, partial [Candidatus Bipolaricaulota bacterium]|nr:1-deoxy-D-xylulose-5-phosphate reductoisomerase [Candidatus Bipolaricaulota bacterium]
RLSLPGLSLEFRELPRDRYPGYWTVLAAGRAGGTAPVAANAADEVLVAAFLAGEIPFPAIAAGLDWVLARHSPTEVRSLSDIEEADSWARARAREFVERWANKP